MKEGHLVDLNQLKAQHTIRKEKALKYFEDCPRLRVDEHEKLSFKELKKKIKDKYHSYVEEAKVSTFSTDVNMHHNYLSTFITT